MRYLSGDDLKRVVDSAGPAFWRTHPFPRKKAEVSFLAGGRTDEDVAGPRGLGTVPDSADEEGHVCYERHDAPG